ncbi:MAG: YdiU family protein [Vicinamibacterales bacterium]
MPDTSAFAPELFTFDNSYARELEGFYAPWTPAQVPAPRLLKVNRGLAAELGLDPDALDSERGARIFGGNEVPPGAAPLAQAYAGHQFGGFSPQLGDGRALLLGEVVDRAGRRRDIALKGSGRTPFSRGGDGKAAVGPVLREYVIGEAMHALGIPTTRALAAVATGETIRRERALPGAVLTRVAASHVRVGTFEFFSARGDHEKVRVLADYVIARHEPDLAGRPGRYLDLLRTVSSRQAVLVAQWMHVGFIHGVMNTDNMALSGETIDYGPCAFMEAFDPSVAFSSIDTGGRYAYGNQPAIAQWNLARLAQALLPLLDASAERAVELARAEIVAFADQYAAAWLAGVRAKLGLTTQDEGDRALAEAWLALLQAQTVDFTRGWRRLADAAEQGDAEPSTADARQPGSLAVPAALGALFTDASALAEWLARWRRRLEAEPVPAAARAEAMRRVNPIYIPRNHKVEEALTAASDAGDLAPFDRLLDAVMQPFDERPGFEAHAAPAPAAVTARYQTFCGT